MASEVFKVQVIFPHLLQIFLQRKSTCSNLEIFQKNLIQRYGFLQWNPLKVEWYDTDGDKIRICNEDDWNIFMELNGTKINIQIDNRWIYTTKTSFANFPNVPIPTTDYQQVQQTLRQTVQKSTGKAPRKRFTMKDASKNVTVVEGKKSSISDQVATNEEVHSEEHEPGLYKQQTNVENASQQPFRYGSLFSTATSLPSAASMPTTTAAAHIPNTTITVPTATPMPISSQTDIYFGITCNSCRGEIRGYGYKCSECPKFDLCTKCEKQKLHKEHQMIRIDDPNTDTDYDPRFWQATLNKYESKTINEEQDNEEANRGNQQKNLSVLSKSCSNGTYEKILRTCTRLQSATMKNVNEEEEPNSGSNPATKHDELQSKEQQSDLPKEKTVENQSEKSAPVLQPIEQSPEITTKPTVVPNGTCEQNTNDSGKDDNSEKPEKNSVVTQDYICPPATTSDSHHVSPAESTDAAMRVADVTGWKQSFPFLPSTKQNNVHSNSFQVSTHGSVNTSFTSNVQNNKSNCNITEMKKPKSNNYESTMFAGKSNDKTADWAQGWSKSIEATQSEFSHSLPVFWNRGTAKNVHHHDPIINDSVLKMISMGYTNSGGWLIRLMENTKGDVAAALDLLEVND